MAHDEIEARNGKLLLRGDVPTDVFDPERFGGFEGTSLLEQTLRNIDCYDRCPAASQLSAHPAMAAGEVKGVQAAYVTDELEQRRGDRVAEVASNKLVVEIGDLVVARSLVRHAGKDSPVGAQP
jgi:hypothetical protein